MREKQETRVWALSQEYPLEDYMATHSSILAWKIQWTEEPDGLQSMGLQESHMTEHTHIHTMGNQNSSSKIAENSDSKYSAGKTKCHY